jgi:rod shape-determining protein MreD
MTGGRGLLAGFIIWATFIVAWVLAVMPLPISWMPWRPEWLSVFLIYWVIALPHRMGLVSAWFLGLLVDAGLGQVLGLHALLYCVVAYSAMYFHLRLRLFTRAQQAAFVLLIISMQKLIGFWALTGAGFNVAPDLSYLYGAITSALLWPLTFSFLRYWRRSWHLA